MNQIIEQSVNDAFRYARDRERILEWMESDDHIATYSELAPDGDGIKMMQADALGFEDSIIRRADTVIKELYRIDAFWITNVP